ncbi:allophanate hydrolase subunit 1 [Oryzobacter terrae]|uniref:5-oxoprolinase subunit B family protein n=1 Tax=Oryzobacter terrae TaxID=1620385 RepID=UPI00366AB198
MPSSAVLRRVEHDGERPATLIRQAGDHQLLVEFEGEGADLRQNFAVHALIQLLEQEPIPGLREAVPGVRTVLVIFDPSVLERDDLLEDLVRLDSIATSLNSLVLPSRRFELPIAFDDELTREAVNRYRITTRMDAPNVLERSNTDYIVQYNGFRDREEFFGTFTQPEWWCASIGFFPGLPSLFSLDPRTQISVPKYNPARMWTPEGAVGMGGPAIVLYPMESPGSYQLFGRTLPITQPASPDSTVEDSHVFRVGDRVRFRRVTENELLKLRLQVLDGTYVWKIEEDDYAVSDYLEDLDRYADSIDRIAQHRAQAATGVEIP